MNSASTLGQYEVDAAEEQRKAERAAAPLNFRSMVLAMFVANLLTGAVGVAIYVAVRALTQ
jgi:hypothetical protein